MYGRRDVGAIIWSPDVIEMKDSLPNSRSPDTSLTDGDLPAKDRFSVHLRRVLSCLYDPAVLRSSPLNQLFGLDPEQSTASALRRILLQAIESFCPNKNTPPGSKAWRVYQILRRRYTEQLTQREVALALGLSTRQLQREEKLARQVLADHLWTAHRLGAQAHLLAPAQEEEMASVPDVKAGAKVLTRAQELAYLQDSVPIQSVDVDQVIRQVIETIDPLAQSLRVPIVYVVEEDMPYLRVQIAILRQALLNIVNVALSHTPRQIEIRASARPQEVTIQVEAAPERHAPRRLTDEHAESLAMARQLVQLCQGTLHIPPGDDGPMLTGRKSGDARTFGARITLVAPEQITVLVIDDNADALQLFRRYLTGSRYRFIGAQSAQQGLALAAASAEGPSPQIIVLDVMMPEQDGWTLLGQLREHPRTKDVPVIVCTILPQEQLALTLGAVEFIRKPVSRPALLAALDRQVASSATA